jgi:hypothetical protein
VPIEEFKRIYLEKADRRPARLLRPAGQSAHAALHGGCGGFSHSLDLGPRVHGVLRVNTPGTGTLPLALDRPDDNRVAANCAAGVAAACISIISINDLQRRVARFREMRTCSGSSRAQVAACRTWNSVEHVVLKTERALLREVIEWHSIRSLQRVPLSARLMNTSFKYRAFISYSHSDEKWARWLHHSLETYRHSENVVGTDDRVLCTVPARFTPYSATATTWPARPTSAPT